MKHLSGIQPPSASASTLGTFLFLLPSAFFFFARHRLQDDIKWQVEIEQQVNLQEILYFSFAAPSISAEFSGNSAP